MYNTANDDVSTLLVKFDDYHFDLRQRFVEFFESYESIVHPDPADLISIRNEFDVFIRSADAFRQWVIDDTLTLGNAMRVVPRMANSFGVLQQYAGILLGAQIPNDVGEWFDPFSVSMFDEMVGLIEVMAALIQHRANRVGTCDGCGNSKTSKTRQRMGLTKDDVTLLENAGLLPSDRDTNREWEEKTMRWGSRTDKPLWLTDRNAAINAGWQPTKPWQDETCEDCRDRGRCDTCTKECCRAYFDEFVDE